METKHWVWLTVVILVIAGVVWYVYRPTEGTNTTYTEQQGTAVEQPSTSVAATEYVVSYDGTAYMPNSVTVKAGDTVVFKNNSTKNMWPASVLHPTHAVYPTTGGCIGSTFDACKGIAPSESWSFKFDVVGSWNYHDHLSPKVFGKVVVQ